MRASITFDIAIVGLAFGMGAAACTPTKEADWSRVLTPATGAGGSMGGADGGAGVDDPGGAAPVPGPVAAAALTTIVPTDGCGTAPVQPAGMAVRHTIQTRGTKEADCADSKCGPWSYVREYFVTLPTGYDPTRAYPVIFEGPGCSGTGKNIFALPDLAGSVIRVGLSPSAEAQATHATQPNQGCFDEKEGDDSVEWPFYEALYDRLASQLCFDRNRVFAAGNASIGGGGWLANELGCRYAGDPLRPVRGVLVSNGGLPTDPRFRPTCTNKPLAGIWIHGVSEPTFPFNKEAIARAMSVDGCIMGTGFDDASFTKFDLGVATAGDICEQIVGCRDVTPLVVCPLGTSSLGRHENISIPAFSKFIKLFENPPLLTQ